MQMHFVTFLCFSTLYKNSLNYFFNPSFYFFILVPLMILDQRTGYVYVNNNIFHLFIIYKKKKVTIIRHLYQYQSKVLI